MVKVLMLALGLTLAALCSLATSLGMLLKHAGASAAPAVRFRAPLASARGLFSQRPFALGMAAAAGGFVLHAGALKLAPLSLVQAVIAGGMVWLAVLAQRMFGVGVSRRQWAGVALAAAGLAVIAAGTPPAGDPSYRVLPLAACEAGLCASAGLLAWRGGGPLALAGAGGLLFGASDVAVKAVTVAGPFTPWLAAAALAGAAAFYACARALQGGGAVGISAATALAANVAGIAGGLAVFGDPLPAGPAGLSVHAAAFACVLAAAWLVPGPRQPAGSPVR